MAEKKRQEIDVAEIIKEVRLRIQGQTEADEPNEQELVALRKEAYRQFLAEEAEKRKQNQIPVILEEKQREPRTLSDFMSKRGWKL